MTDPRARGEGVCLWVDAHLAVAACVGLCLLAGTALPGLWSSGPPFPAGGRPEAADHAGAMRSAGERALAAVPATADRQAAATGAERPASPSRTIDINRADAADLQRLPGIGPALARRIVAHRGARGPFRDPADLLQVPGVGAMRFARLQGLIRTAEAP